jgi:putative hydrolase of the HAD superfamily
MHDKGKMIMIGDSLSSDIRGGVNFGIDTCWFNPSVAPNPTELKPTYEIRSLEELKRIL